MLMDGGDFSEEVKDDDENDDEMDEGRQADLSQSDED